ncbi:MAG: hypothetical protein ABIK86_04515 [candidate division WOR-3 bacterium]
MRLVLMLVVLYVLCLVQVAAGPYFPQLALASVIIMSWRYDSASPGWARLDATLMGAFAGLCLDLSSPGSVGPNLLVLALSGYAAAALKLVIYRGRWAVTLLCFAALVARWLLLALGGSLSMNLTAHAVSSVLTLVLVYLGTRFFAASP